MPLSVASFIFLLMSHVLSSVSFPMEQDTAEVYNNPKYVPGYMHHSRLKRSLFGIGRTFFEGIIASNKLTQKAIPILTTPGNRKAFVKEGDYLTAKTDFFSVNPMFVRRFQRPGGDEGITGIVGDRKLLVEKRNDPWKATITIIKGRGTKNERVKTIDYVDMSNRFQKR